MGLNGEDRGGISATLSSTRYKQLARPRIARRIVRRTHVAAHHYLVLMPSFA